MRKIVSRFALTVIFCLGGVFVFSQAYPASEALRLQREHPPLARTVLTEAQQAELRQHMAEAGPAGKVVRVHSELFTELGELLVRAGQRADVENFVRLLTRPISTGDTKTDIILATVRGNFDYSTEVWVSADGNMAVLYLPNSQGTTIDIYENTPKGILNTLLIVRGDGRHTEEDKTKF